MATRVISTRLAVDGEAEFKKQMSSVNGELRNLKTEMQLTDAQFKGQANTLDYLTQKDKLLRAEVEQQAEKVRALETALEDATKAYGEADSRTDKYQQQLNQARAALVNLNREVETNAQYMDEAAKSSKNTAKSIDEYGKSTKDAKGGVKSLGDLIKANLTSEAIIGGVKALAGAMKEAARAAIELGKESVEAAAQVNAENSQFEQTFGDLGDNAAAAIQRVADSSGILDTRLRPAASQIYAFARASGGDAVESMDLMETALQAAADSAAYYDRSLEDTTDSLMSFLKGNFSNDAALGVSATETTRNAAAMELFGQKYNDLSEVQKQQTLLKMVTDAQELSGAMGQAAREAEGWENVQGNLNEALRQAKADIGQELLPSVTELSQAFTGVLSGEMYTEQFAETAAGIVAELTTSFADQAPEMVDAGVQMLTAFLEGLMKGDSTEQIADSMAEIIISLVDGGVEMLPNIVEFAIRLISTLAISLVQHIPDLAAKVPDIIFGIVEALVKGIPDIANVGVALIQGLLDGITSMIGAVINIILDPILIFGFGLGVRGAAIATVLSQAVGAAWIIRFLTGKKTILRLRRDYLRPEKQIILPVLALGISSFVMLSTESLLSISFSSSLARYGGDVAVGAMTVITSASQLCTLPIQGICQGGQPVMSFNFGAGKKARVKEAFRFQLTLCGSYTCLFWLLMMLFPGAVAGIFTSDTALIQYTTWAMRIYMAGIFAMGFQIACQQSFMALGQAKVSLLLACLRKIILLIPLIFILPHVLPDAVFGVFLAEPVSDILAATITTITFFARFDKILDRGAAYV